MQSFSFKTLCCILIINVTLCRSCFNGICKASCYARQGTDLGSCVKGVCRCETTKVYVFDGIGRDLSDNLINISLSNKNLIQNSISTSKYAHRPARQPNALQANNKIWKKIIGKITQKYPFVSEGDLKNLKMQLFKKKADLNDFYGTLFHQSLENALGEMKNNKPVDDLLKLLRKHRGVKNNRTGNNVDILSNYKLVVEESGESSAVNNIGVNTKKPGEDNDDDDGGSTEKSDEENDGGEAKDSKQPRQVVKGGDKTLASSSEYEYLEDDDDDEKDKLN